MGAVQIDVCMDSCIFWNVCIACVHFQISVSSQLIFVT
jgi:hypothetical protein